jgi:hypothetical protein
MSEQYFASVYRIYSVRIYILMWINVMHHVKETVYDRLFVPVNRGIWL